MSCRVVLCYVALPAIGLLARLADPVLAVIAVPFR